MKKAILLQKGKIKSNNFFLKFFQKNLDLIVKQSPNGWSVENILFGLSVAGIILNRNNLIMLLMCIELMLLAVNTNFIAFSHFSGDSAGQVFVFFILTVAAAEAAIGLAILMVLFRTRNSINVGDLDLLKG